MPYNFAAESFHTKQLCSRLSSSEVHFFMEIDRFAFLRPPLGNLGATYDDLDRYFYRFVTIHACDGQTDRRRDRQTDRILIARPRLHCMVKAVKVKLSLIGSPLRAFPSLSWTACIASKPHQGLINAKSLFLSKTALLSKNVCYKVSSCENRQRQNMETIDIVDIDYRHKQASNEPGELSQ